MPVEERDDNGKRRLTGGQDNARGTPQGGEISPALANLYMNRMLKGWRQTRQGEKLRAQIVNYAMEQVTDEQLFALRDEEANSIGIAVKHMAGNMRSRWTDFLTTDGEKPDRDRDSEFVDPPATRKALMGVWEDGWTRLFQALEPLSDADLGSTITIRGEPHSVMQAVNRQMAHYAYHVGQIVMLAKHFAHDHWQSLSVPRNRAEFTQRVAAGELSQR